MNYLQLLFTIVALTAPSNYYNTVDERPSRILLFDQSATGNYAFCQSMWDSVYPFESRIADNFILTVDAYVDSVVWWGGYWSFPTNPLVDFWIEFYAESTGYAQPVQEPMYVARVDFAEIDLGGYYRYEATLPPCGITNNEMYWVVFMATIVFPPHWGNTCSWPANSPGWGDGQESYFKSTLFGYLEWTTASSSLGEPYESSFQLYGTLTGVEENSYDNTRQVYVGVSSTPNPAYMSSIHITYSIRTAGHVSLSVYDCAGTLICRLVDSWRGPGTFTLQWDGTDMSRRPVPDGIYFVKMESGDYSGQSKLILLR